jgi:hypothetical protein
MSIRDLTYIINTYNNVYNKHNNIEFEIQFIPKLSNTELFHIFKKYILEELVIYTISHSLRLFDKESQATCVEFADDGTKKIYKMHKSNVINSKVSGYNHSYYNNNEFGDLKVKLKYENIINDNSIPENPDRLRLSKRFIFNLYHQEWSLHITFIKNLDSVQQIKDWKIKMFGDIKSGIEVTDDQFLERVESEQWLVNNDMHIEIELEHHNNTAAFQNWPEIDLYNMLYRDHHRANYLHKLRSVYWMIHPNKLFTSQNKTKTIVSQAIEPDRKETEEFWKECIRNNRVQIGVKNDGLRAIALFIRHDSGQFDAKIITDVEIKDTLNLSKQFMDIFNIPGTYILDLEYLDQYESNETRSKSKMNFEIESSVETGSIGSSSSNVYDDNCFKFIYPLIWVSENIRKKDFLVGLQIMNNCIPKEYIAEFIEYNNFANPSIKESMINQITQINKLSDIDGLIVRTGNSYESQKAIKIKPESKIDFLIKKCPLPLRNIYPYVIEPGSGVTSIYLLFVGITRHKLKSYHMRHINGYKQMFIDITDKDSYIPHHFNVIGSMKNVHIWYCKDKNINDSGFDKFDNQVGEFSYQISTSEWKLLKLRPDKSGSGNMGGFGNNIAAATSIWNNFNDPFTLTNIISKDYNTEFLQNDNTLLNTEQIRIITSIIGGCTVKKDLIVVGTNYVGCKGINRSHILWPSDIMGTVPDSIMKNIHSFTKYGSNVTLDNTLDWKGTKPISLPTDLITGSFIVIAKVPELYTDNSGTYSLILKKRYISLVQEAGYLITITDIPEKISEEVREKITDTNNKLIKKSHHVVHQSGELYRHIITWYKRSFSKDNIAYQDVGLENPHLLNAFNYKQQGNKNIDINDINDNDSSKQQFGDRINLINDYSRQIIQDINPVNIHRSSKILDSSLCIDHHKEQLLCILEFLTKINNKHVLIEKILVDDSVVCVNMLKQLYPLYTFITNKCEVESVDVVISWNNYLEVKELLVAHNPMYVMCVLTISEDLFKKDVVLELPRCEKYYIPYSDWNNIYTCVIHLNNFREHNPVTYIRSRVLVEQLKYFQYVLRPSLYKYIIAEDLIKIGGYDGCYDCRTEILIVSRYLTRAKTVGTFDDKIKTASVIKIINNITE